MADARARKAVKYHDLVEAGRAAGYRAKLLNLVVGSRGMLGDADFDLLREATDAPRKECTSVCLSSPHHKSSHSGLLLHLGLKKPCFLTNFRLLSS